MSGYTAPALIDGLKKGSRGALGRAITVMENDGEGKRKILDYAFASANADIPVIGITGAAGAGKSTLIDKMIREYRKRNYLVGVLAVDPSSPFTGGAMLGDRLRMGTHNADSGVFIRSFASRGARGGLYRAVGETLYLYQAFEFDIIFLETSGTGQTETDITDYADVTAVVLAPGNGDDIQMSKAGIMEIADIFVINKADKPEAETLYRQLQVVFGCSQRAKHPEIVMTSATKGQGIPELIDRLSEVRGQKQNSILQKWKRRIVDAIVRETMPDIHELLKKHAGLLAEDVLAGTCTLSEAMDELKERVHVKKI